jgi:hypothetical protein
MDYKCSSRTHAVDMANINLAIVEFVGYRASTPLSTQGWSGLSAVETHVPMSDLLMPR